MRRISALKLFFLLLLTLFLIGDISAQENPLFKKSELDSFGIRCYELLCTKGGSVVFTTSIGLWKIKGQMMEGPSVSTGMIGIKNFRDYLAEDSIRAMAEGPDSIFFYATHDNILSYSENSNFIGGVGWPPFYFPPKGQSVDRVASLFIDSNGDLYIGTQGDNFYTIQGGANKQSIRGTKMKVVDSIVVPDKGEMPVKKITLAPYTGVYSFVQDNIDKSIIWIGTNYGLYRYNKGTGESKKIMPVNGTADLSFTVTHIDVDKQDNLWFSTLEKGMGIYRQEKNSIRFFLYPKKNSTSSSLYPIKTFCRKSDHSFFVAVMDSLPAIFDMQSGMYAFIDDPSLKNSANTTTDIKVDKLGNLLVIKGGALYKCKASESDYLASAIKPDSSLLAPFIRSVSLLNGEEIASITYNPENLSELRLKYNQNSFWIFYDINDFGDKSKIQFAWKIQGVTQGWVMMPQLNMDSSNFAFADHLKPGKYLFEVKVKVGNEEWRKQQAKMMIIIAPPFWQTWWFWIVVISGAGLIIGIILWWRIRAIKKREKGKFAHEKQILELEAKALRAQMNPHFIFNCMNSIKSLIQQQEEEKAVTYLTTFSKLIRTLFNNADKKEISLYDEIETCKYYLQLEAMRFDSKFVYSVNIDEHLDLKSIQVPALIIQPFIENAIWHGIVPKGVGGSVSVSIRGKNGRVEIEVEDDGVGREASQQHKSASHLSHQSKGVNLTQSRLELDNLLQQRQAILETIDKKNEDGTVAGTKVIITITEEI